MTRRASLAAAALPFSASFGQTLIRPKALQPGDTVGLITPSTYVSDPDRLALTERTIRYFGLTPKFAPNVKKRDGYLGGTVKERVADLHAMFSDRDVKAVFCIRGGFGSAHRHAGGNWRGEHSDRRSPAETLPASRERRA